MGMRFPSNWPYVPPPRYEDFNPGVWIVPQHIRGRPEAYLQGRDYCSSRIFQELKFGDFATLPKMPLPPAYLTLQQNTAGLRLAPDWTNLTNNILNNDFRWLSRH